MVLEPGAYLHTRLERPSKKPLFWRGTFQETFRGEWHKRRVISQVSSARIHFQEKMNFLAHKFGSVLMPAPARDSVSAADNGEALVKHGSASGEVAMEQRIGVDGRRIGAPGGRGRSW